MLPRQTGPSLFPRDIYQLRPEIRDPHRYNPGTIARRNGLGLGQDPISTAFSFVGGLFHQKSPGQIAFDEGRQVLYDEAVSVQNYVDSTNGASWWDSPTSDDYPALVTGIAKMQSIIARHDALRSQALASGVDPAWIAPRYAENDRVFQGFLTSWRDLASRVKPSGVLDSISNFIFGPSTPDVAHDTTADIYGAVHPASTASSWLLPAAIIGGIFLMTRKSKVF
jgi:hypothetical protein